MIKVETHDTCFLVKIPWDYSTMAKTIPAYKWNVLAKAWQYPANPVSAANLFMLAQEIGGMRIEGDHGFDYYLNEFKRIGTIKKSPPITEGYNWQLKTKMWSHQLKGAEFAVNVKRGLLDMFMGTGKSLTGIAASNAMMLNSVLILCPKSVINVWPNQFRIHSAREYEIIVMNQPTVTKKMDFLRLKEQRLKIGKIPHVVVLNYDSAWREPLASYLSEYGFNGLFMDESHRIKSPKANISKYIFKRLCNIPVALALTGTAMEDKPLDIFGQYRALNTSVFGLYYNNFKEKFIKMGGYGNYQVLGYKNEVEFRKRFEMISFTATKNDAPDLPEQVECTIEVDLKPSTRKMYDKLSAEFTVEVEAGTVTAFNALVKLVRLQQITSGFVVTEEGKTEMIDSCKRDTLKDLLQDVRMPVIVFCRFHNDLDQIHEICKTLGLKSGELSGRSNDLDQDAKLPERIDVLATQIRSGGSGVDLSRSSTAIYYSLGYSLGEYQQSRSRLHRHGQVNKVAAIHLIAKKTVDGKILKAIQSKKKVIDELIRKVDAEAV